MHRPAVHRMAMSREGRFRFNVGGLSADRCNPIADGLSNELRSVVRPNEGWNTAQDKQVCQRIDDLCRIQFPFHLDRQAFPAVFIQDVERLERFPSSVR